MFSSKDRVALLEVLIALAYSDGDFADVERQRIVGLIDFFNLSEEDSSHVHRLLNAPPQELPTVATMPAYHLRRYVFTQAVMLAYEDGVIDEGEQELLERLAQSLELNQDDVDTAWVRAEELA